MELDTFTLCHLIYSTQRKHVLIQYINRGVRSLHILEYKDEGVLSEPLTRQSHTAKYPGL